MTLSFAVLPLALPATTTLVEHGPRVHAIVAAHPALQSADPAARAQAASAVPAADLAYVAAHGADVASAQKDNPRQWQTWWWICFAGQLVFIPFVFLMAGRWSPRQAREDAAAHEQLVERELARLQTAGA